MYQSPYNSPYVTLQEGLNGATLGRTLAYLLSFLAIGFATTVAMAGRPAVWLGFGLTIFGTLMVNRAAVRGSGAYLWGALVAVGMGIMVGPFILAVAVTNPHVFLLSGVALILAIAIAATVVAWVPWDFTRMAPLLMVGLIGLLAAGLLSMLLPGIFGVAMSPVYSMIGVLVFTGYLMVDLSILKYRRVALPGNGAAVLLAVRLFVDIVNLFLFLITLGSRR